MVDLKLGMLTEYVVIVPDQLVATTDVERADSGSIGVSVAASFEATRQDNCKTNGNPKGNREVLRPKEASG